MKTQHAVNNNGKTEKRVKLIEEYYNTINPDMSYKDFEAICKTPFQHMRNKLANDELYEIRFKYLGKFTPMPANVVWLLKRATERYEQELVTQSSYNKTMLMLTDYISKNPKAFERFKDEISKWIKI